MEYLNSIPEKFKELEQQREDIYYKFNWSSKSYNERLEAQKEMKSLLENNSQYCEYLKEISRNKYMLEIITCGVLC